MIKASSYVLKNMSAMLDQLVSLEHSVETGNHDFGCGLSGIRGAFDKLSLRYKNDDGLQSICDEFEQYLEHRDGELMERITRELEELIYIRKLETLVRELRHLEQNEQSINMT
jgi:hypothetical protein